MQVGSIQSALHSGLSPVNGSARSATRIYTEPQDTNQDSIISPVEVQAYALKHLTLNLTLNQAATDSHLPTFADYTHKGLRNQVPEAIPGLLDLRA
ncbi:MAG: hypothetical protein HY014_05910 [Acidobacteria bacterium]|nr:hypothetical protein [Acidobacteriota bacterium]MBI3487682.1 hypothetical protein [Acidobacteriota bacterium]